VIPDGVAEVAADIERILFTAALFAIGVSVHLPTLRRIGPRPALTSAGVWIWCHDRIACGRDADSAQGVTGCGGVTRADQAVDRLARVDVEEVHVLRGDGDLDLSPIRAVDAG
jgi:hypothetical protein